MKRTVVSCHGSNEVGGLARGASAHKQRGDCGSLIHANGELGQVVSLQRDGSLQARAPLSFHHEPDRSKAERGPELGSVGRLTVKVQKLQDQQST